ncbi:hypothetical protein BD413DRAFT_8469 [Trametes elegans]|nr:hypothetical protein BD413DRAFT_8469 [Trametes elegans]
MPPVLDTPRQLAPYTPIPSLPCASALRRAGAWADRRDPEARGEEEMSTRGGTREDGLYAVVRLGVHTTRTGWEDVRYNTVDSGPTRRGRGCDEGWDLCLYCMYIRSEPAMYVAYTAAPISLLYGGLLRADYGGTDARESGGGGEKGGCGGSVVSGSSTSSRLRRHQHLQKWTERAGRVGVHGVHARRTRPAGVVSESNCNNATETARPLWVGTVGWGWGVVDSKGYGIEMEGEREEGNACLVVTEVFETETRNRAQAQTRDSTSTGTDRRGGQGTKERARIRERRDNYKKQDPDRVWHVVAGSLGTEREQGLRRQGSRMWTWTWART